MILLEGNNVSKFFGEIVILDNISFTIRDTDKIGLIARNGTGKTTLFRVLTNSLYYEKGEIKKADRIKIGYLPQEVAFESSLTLYELMNKVFADLFEMHKRIKKLEHEISEKKKESDIKEYGELLHEFEDRDGYNIDTNIQKVLSGLSFTPDDYDKEISQFSGGERRRAFLAKLLLEKADILILDEPTNHLDIFNTQWLESYLKDFKGSILMVSHDRTFLDSIINKTWYLKDSNLNEYKGNYTQFKKQLEIEEELLEKESRKQKEYIERTEEYIRRNMEGQKTKQAQARLKKLEKIEIINAPSKEFKPRYKFEAEYPSGFIALQAEKINFSYETDRKLIQNLSLIVEKSEKIGIVGLNGSGKSTFIKLLLEELEPKSGWIKFGTKISLGYFSQNFENLNYENRIVDEVRGRLFKYTIPEMRNYLSSFGFYEDDVFKDIKQLSGGEKSRTAFAKLILRNHNFLILDEPTNHLDLENIEALESGLKNYNGTLLMVSHDRSLLNNVCSKILFFFPDKPAKLYLGNLDYALEKIAQEEQNQNSKTEMNMAENTQKTDKEVYLENKKRVRNLQNEKRKLEKGITEIENNIETLEAFKLDIQNKLSLPEVFTDGLKVKKLSESLKNTEEEIEKAYNLLENSLDILESMDEEL